MDLQDLLDREEIRCLQDAYNIAGDRGRVAELAQVFASDGVLALRGGDQVGPEAIAASLANVGQQPPAEGADRPKRLMRHNLTTRQVVFDSPTEARGRLYFMVYSEIGPDHMGVYVDRYRKVDGAWKIARREVRVDWFAEGSPYVRSASRG
jgi:hypothetical protein